MSTASCATPTPMAILEAYWLGELDGARESELEEHLFGCARCSSRVRELVQLADGIRSATREGRLHGVVSAPFIRDLQEAGVRVREYSVHPGASVLCTVSPEDDLVIAHLHAPLQNVRRLDVVVHDVTAGRSWRLEDVAFDSTTDQLVMLPNVAELRKLTFATQEVRLYAVEDTTERVIAEYTFNHSPHWSVAGS